MFLVTSKEERWEKVRIVSEKLLRKFGFKVKWFEVLTELFKMLIWAFRELYQMLLQKLKNIAEFLKFLNFLISGKFFSFSHWFSISFFFSTFLCLFQYQFRSHNLFDVPSTCTSNRKWLIWIYLEFYEDLEGGKQKFCGLFRLSHKMLNKNLKGK